MAYSSSEKPTPSSASGTQYVEFQLSLDYTPQAPWVKTGKYQWGPLWKGQTGGMSPPTNMLLVKGDGNGASAPGAAYSPGVKEVWVDCQIKDPNVPNSEVWVHFSNTCAVIGGPLTFEPEAMGYMYNNHVYGDGDGWTFTYYPWAPGHNSSPPVAVQLPDQDDNKLTNPYHLQYFGFNPINGVPNDSQRPRAKLAVAALPQPEGTIFTWELPSGAPFTVTAGGASSDASLEGYATGPGQFSVTCRFTLTYTNTHGSDTLTLFPDNTTSTPNPIDPTKDRVRTVNSHQPTNTVLAGRKDFKNSAYVSKDVFGNWQVANNWSWCGLVDEIELLSQLGSKMPAVWVQERFVAPLPPSWFTINNNSHPTWSTVGWEEPAHMGRFYWDYLSLYVDPLDPNLAHTWTFNHEYWAATRSTNQGGLKVGTWQMVFSPGTTPNSIGTVTHTKIN